MSKNSCKAAESIEDAVHDNRMFAERAFYCIVNGAGNCANGAGNWLLTRKNSQFTHAAATKQKTAPLHRESSGASARRACPGTVRECRRAAG